MSVVEAQKTQQQGVSSIKSHYYKYLEALCVANGINITTLKNGAVKIDKLEMFFGGLPAIVGLRYFDNLHVLCLVGQNITSLTPLSDVADSLEELWVCEGSLKDLSGVETCKQLRRLYLYNCAIENGEPISHLTSLDVLWIQNNRLTEMQVGCVQTSVKLNLVPQFVAILNHAEGGWGPVFGFSVENWAPKLQHLDLDGNCLTSFKPLLSLCGCEVIRHLELCSGKYAPSGIIQNDCQLAWIAYHFPFLERLNRDAVTEKFITTYTTTAETAWFDEFNRATKAEREFWTRFDLIERNFDRINDRLASFINALGKAASAMTKKEGRRDLTIKYQEQSQLRMKTLKKVKCGMLEYEHALYYFSSYLLPSWRLESGYQSPARELNKNELQSLEEVLQKFCLKNDEPKLRLKYAWTFVITAGDLVSSQMKSWWHVESKSSTSLWDLQGVVDLCDRQFTKNYCTEMKLFKNLIPLCNNAQNTKVFVLSPLMQTKPSAASDQSAYESTNGDSAITYEPQSEKQIVSWTSLELVAVCLIELQRTAQCTFEELLNLGTFEENFNDQVKKLKEVGIDLKLEKTTTKRAESLEDNEESVDVTESAAKDQKKEECTLDCFNADLPVYRYRAQLMPWNNRTLSLRNALELTIAYGSPCGTFERTQFCKTVTCLDLSNLHISKLDGIDNLVNLRCLNLANNKINTLKKLKALKVLIFLDISKNLITKIDDLPSLLVELRASRNSLTCLGFCTKLQLLTRLNVANNRIKSLKGIEQCKLLQIFIASDNQIKLTNNELEIFANFPQLSMIDLIGNPTVESESYRKRLLCLVPSLLSIDYDKVPVEERLHIVRKSGKVLTFECIEKLIPDWQSQSSLNLDNQCFQMIALDRNAALKLQHIVELNLSNNFLEHIYELADLKALNKLKLAGNRIVRLCNGNFDTSPQIETFPELEELDLSFNNLNCQNLARIKLEKLPRLRHLILVGNHLTRFDGAQFDFPNLEEIDLSRNEIRSIRKKMLSHLLSLNLADNRLKDLNNLEVPKLQYFDVSNNRIGSCTALKNLKLMKGLKTLNCAGNPVTERRVYHEFIKGTLKNLEKLDSTVVQQDQNQLTTSNSCEVLSTQSNASTTKLQLKKSLPPLIKLANSQCSDVKCYYGMIQRMTGPFPEIANKSGTTESANGKATSAMSAKQRMTLSVQLTKLPRSQSMEFNRISLLTRPKPDSAENFSIAGTKAVKHYRQ